MGSGVLLGSLLQPVSAVSFDGSLPLVSGKGVTDRSSLSGLLTVSLSLEQEAAGSMDFLLFLPLLGVLSGGCLAELDGVILPLLDIFLDELVSLALLPLHELELDCVIVSNSSSLTDEAEELDSVLMLTAGPLDSCCCCDETLRSPPFDWLLQVLAAFWLEFMIAQLLAVVVEPVPLAPPLSHSPSDLSSLSKVCVM